MIFHLSSAIQYFYEEAGLFFKLAISILFFYLLLPKPSYKTKVKVPTIKFVSPWLPEILSRLLFNSYAPSVIYDGYAKVRLEPVLQSFWGRNWHRSSTKRRDIKFWKLMETWLFFQPSMLKNFGNCRHQPWMPLRQHFRRVFGDHQTKSLLILISWAFRIM